MTAIPEWNKELLLQTQMFAPLHPTIHAIHGDGFPSLNECNRLLGERPQLIKVSSRIDLRFVEQEYGKLPFEAQYEPRCYLKGEVPTRTNNWHDLLNALVWLTFPKAKAAINARHYAALTVHNNHDGGSERGSVRDAITLLDESGVVVPYADTELASLLRDFQWKTLFWNHRNNVKFSMGFYLFGHGLYEKALSPYVGMTGQGRVLPVEQEFFTWPIEKRLAHLDGLLADYLTDSGSLRSTHDLSPVPLLGIPGWTDENRVATYYDNTHYFRSGRQSAAQRKPLNTAPSIVAG